MRLFHRRRRPYATVGAYAGEDVTAEGNHPADWSPERGFHNPTNEVGRRLVQREAEIDAAVREGLRRASLNPQAWGLDVPWMLDVSGVMEVILAAWRDAHPDPSLDGVPLRARAVDHGMPSR